METYVQKHVKTFRPFFLVMSKGSKDSLGLVHFAYLLGADQGASLFLRVIERKLVSENASRLSNSGIIKRSSTCFAKIDLEQVGHACALTQSPILYLFVMLNPADPITWA